MLAATETTSPGGCAATGGALRARLARPAASQFTILVAGLDVVIR